MRAFRRLLVQRTDDLCAAVAADIGKKPLEVLGGELLPLAEACRFLQQEAPRLLRPRRIPGRLRPAWMWGQRDDVYRRPRGVIGLIGTWNYPLFLNGVQILQALTAGNAMLWKPSELAPKSAAALAGLLTTAGFPDDLVIVLENTRAAGAALLEASIDHVVFTGSAETGRLVARRLAERLISSTLELSGCDPQFVLADADVKLAARAAWFGATLNGGQTCIAVRRAFVHRSVYDPFCAALRELSADAKPVRLAQRSQVQLAARLVSEALAEGGRFLHPSMALPADGLDCPALVIADARPQMALCREASFAPLLAILPFEDLDEAMRQADRCPYHLAASIFSDQPRQVDELAAQLSGGTVAINDVIMATAHPATPFGGQGASGWGVTQGAEGLLEMTVPQVVSRRGGRFRPHYDLAPGQSTGGRLEAQEGLLRGFLAAGHGGSIWQRGKGWWQVARAAWRWWRAPQG